MYKKLIVGALISMQAVGQVDPKAVQIATQTIKAMGGQKGYNHTRHISFNFFGARRITWDKFTGDVRIDVLKTQTTYLFNTNTKAGKVFANQKEAVVSADSLKKLMRQAEGMWINDTYWLLMPFKLLDPGVHLKYLGTEKLADGTETDKLEMSFDKVGFTPDNKYQIWIDKSSHLVHQWAYYKNSTDATPGFVRPWTDYQTYGRIKLSGERGDRDLTDIRVFDALPPSTYTQPDEPQFGLGKELKPKK